MKNIRLRKWKVCVICFLFIFSALNNIVLAENTYHLENCAIYDCPTCMIIQNAINFINILIIIVICIKLLARRVSLSSLITNTISSKKVFSLIQFQVQHNE